MKKPLISAFAALVAAAAAYAAPPPPSSHGAHAKRPPAPAPVAAKPSPKPAQAPVAAKPAPQPAPAPVAAKPAPQPAPAPAAHHGHGGRGGRVHLRSPYDHLPPAERRELDRLERAVDRESLHRVREFAVSLGASKFSESRIAYVDALGDFGERAMPEIAGYFADPDPAVVEAAIIAWQAGLSDVGRDSDKYRLIEETMAAVTNPAALDMLAGELTSLDNDRRIRSALRRIAEGPNPAAARTARRYLRADEPEPPRHRKHR